MQTARINTVKTHLAMSVNAFSTPHYRFSHLILPPTHNMAWMTSDSGIFWHPGFVCRRQRALAVRVDPTNTSLGDYSAPPAIPVFLH